MSETKEKKIVAASASRTAKKVVVAKKTVAKRPARKSASKPPVKEMIGAQEMRAYIPDPSIASRYVNRKVFGVWDARVGDRAYAQARNILLMGETGAGKTLFGEAWAAKRSLPYYSLPCDISVDTTAITGKLQPTEIAGMAEWVDGPLAEIMRHGGVFNISEVNMMSPKIAAVLYPVLDGRRYLVLLGHKGEVLRAHIGTEVPNGEGGFRKCWCSLSADECNAKRVLVIADMNPNYRGTIELNAAFLNRFGFKIPWNYDPTVEERLIKLPTVREIAKELRNMHGTVLMTPTSTNMLMEFEAFANDKELGIEFAMENFASAFHINERQAVMKVVELNVENIKKDQRFLSRSKKSRNPVSDDDLEELDFEFEDEG